MTSAQEHLQYRFIGGIPLLMGTAYVWFDFARAGDTTYAGWQQYPVLAVIGGMMITVGAIQMYWHPLSKFVALGWFYMFLGAGQIAIAAIGWEPTEFRFPPGAIAGLVSIIAGIVCFVAHPARRHDEIGITE